MPRRFAPYIALATLFLVAAGSQARRSYLSVSALIHFSEVARRPFTLEPFGPVITSLKREAEDAGLRKGDRILSVEGRPFSGAAVLESALARARAGDSLRLTVRGGETALVRLAPSSAGVPGAVDWLLPLVLQTLMPVVCLLLGFWVVALRPRDPLAWLLLALLLGFSLIGREQVRPWSDPWLIDAETLYQGICGGSWGIWMLLFGIYFPERWSVDRRWPWAKWVLMVPTVFFTLANASLAVVTEHSFATAAPLDKMLQPFQTPATLAGMLCVSGFFAGLGTKYGMAQTSDARRRLRLLHTGAVISLTPLFLVVVHGMVRGLDPMLVTPVWVLLPALLMLFLFPLTLAYVIVVHQALDVRVVIRQGVQYAFARRGVQVLRILLTLTIFFALSILLSRPNTRQVDILRTLGVGASLALIVHRVGVWVAKWTDRRFFREAYDAEQILSDLGEQVRTMVETGPLLETVGRRISESLHVPRVAVLLDSVGGYVPAYTLGYDTVPAVRFPESAVTIHRLKGGHEPVRVHPDDPRSWVNDERLRVEGELEMLRTLGTQLLLPLAVKDRLSGFISLGAKRSEEPYSGTDVRLLQSVATQAGLALENSRLAAAIVSEVAQRERLNREVEIAREVQERLFPQTLPAISGLDYAGACRPALGVGGDYYDFLALPEGRLGIAIGDVSGKGIAAALLMASLQASLRGQTIEGSGDLARIMANVNRLVYDASADNRYATFFYAQYDPAARRLSFVNAGHCPPIILRQRDGAAPEVIRLEAGGTVVGLIADTPYKEARVDLRPGDLFIGYTDGISEAFNAAEEEWGEERLIAAAGRCDGLPASDTIARLLRDADAFVAGAPQHDDMTLVVLRVAR